MDTITHTLMGGTIVGLAAIDPSIEPLSVGFITTIVGASLVPDVDTIMKFKNNAVYITHHRGITHSLPFTFLIWPVLLTLLSSLLFDLPMLNTYLWVQFAVFLHVFVDIFNSYGTQALRPINNTWIQLGTINTIDIPILVMHVLYFVFWYLGASPAWLFVILYAAMFIYYIARFAIQKFLIGRVEKQLPNEYITRVFCIPTIRFFEWRIVVVTQNSYYVGRSFEGNIIFYDRFNKSDPLEAEIFKSVKKDSNFKAFTFFSSIYRYEISELSEDRVEVRYIDLRYLKDGHYPFVCILQIDKDDFTVRHSYTGWVFSESKLQKKLVEN
ncbi:metal-dependent hydrolase [Salinicoccus albus]|uniref:metal-dependent hydrolase n=1 Tax=Salinicoccus albus TaxID=418756 RepID=UPI00037E7C0A|nr:metal-dependent hydrolase [Salinicoccus albus]